MSRSDIILEDNAYNRRLIGTSIAGLAATDTLYVSPNGKRSDGTSWVTAYTTIQAALDAASTDGGDLTQILISPHATNYNIDTTGDPTYTGNYVLSGSIRNWAKIKNTHGTATSILKFTGKVCMHHLNFNLGTGSGNGLILTHGGSRLHECMFVGEDLTGAATALHFDGAAQIKHCRVADCDFLGEGTTHMTGLLVDTCARSVFERLRLHDCKTAIQIVNADSDYNMFHFTDIGDSGIGFDIDAGNEQHIVTSIFHHCTTNIDDEVGDHVMDRIGGYFPVQLLPDDFTGVTLPTGNGADVWGADTEILAAAGRAKPFRVTGVSMEADATEKFRVRLSADAGATHFTDIQIEGENAVARRQSIQLPPGTEQIFNYNTKISGSSKSESIGIDNAVVWLEIQEI